MAKAKVPTTMSGEPLVAGQEYEVKHTTGIIVTTFICMREVQSYGKTRAGHAKPTQYRYDFVNLKTGREIIIKTAHKILRRHIPTVRGLGDRTSTGNR